MRSLVIQRISPARGRRLALATAAHESDSIAICENENPIADNQADEFSASQPEETTYFSYAGRIHTDFDSTPNLIADKIPKYQKTLKKRAPLKNEK